MKKIVIYILMLVGIYGIIMSITYASESDCPGKWDSEFGCPGDYDKAVADQAKSNSSSTSASTTIFTSEKVPGANCVPVQTSSTQKYEDESGDTNGSSLTTRQNGDGTTTLISKDNNGIEKSTTLKSNDVAQRKYKCTLPTGLAGFQSILAQIIRWVINIVLLLGVLAVVGLGIAWSFAGGDDIKAKSTLKKWAVNIIIGLIILFFFKYILAFLAPWVYQ